MRFVRLLLAACFALSAAAAPATAQEGAPERLEGGEALKWRRPIRAWPLLELDRYDRHVLGAQPGRSTLWREVDFDLLWPLFGYHSERHSYEERFSDRGYFYVLPLWVNTWSGSNHTHSLVPLYTWWELSHKKGLTVYPALFDLDVWKDGDWELDFPWPLGKFGAGGEGDWHSRLWPVWWAGADEDEWWWTIFPVIGAWQAGYETGSGYSETGLITPLGGGWVHPQGHYAMVTPLYHEWSERDEHSRLLLPLFFQYEADETRALVTPLASFVKHRGDLYWAATPLYHRWRSEQHDEGVDIFFPLFWNVFEGDEQFTLAIPFGVWWRDRSETVNAIGPFWSRHERDGGVSGGVFPLLHVNLPGDGDWDVWAPWPSVWFGARGEQSWFNVAPALYTQVNSHGVHIDVAPGLLAPFGKWLFGSSDFYLGVGWPLGLSFATGADSTTWWLGPGAVSWWNNSDGDWAFRLLYEGLAVEREDDRFEWRLLYRFLRYRSTNDSFLFEFNPFFRYESEGDDWHFSPFMGMYQVWTHGDESRHQLFWSIEW